MKKTIGIFAHVDAGKTTFSEQLLYHTKSIRSLGRVDYKTSFLDNNDIEKERGITIFAEQAVFNIDDNKYVLLDTPGHVDFSAEMERALSVIDYGILLVSAVEGVQGHTETVWNLLKKYNVPTFIFINKIDRVGASVEETILDIKENLTKDVVLVNKIKDMDEELIEFISEKNEDLLERYFEGNYEENLWIEEFKKQIKNKVAYPCFVGSALLDKGIKEFIEGFNELTYTNYKELVDKPFKGRVYKVRYDKAGTRNTYIKALEGRLKVRDEISYVNKDRLIEKVSSIKIPSGNKSTIVNEVEAGDLFVVTGITSLKAGDGINEEKINFNIMPTLKSKVIYEEKLNVKDVLGVFRILESEEPALNILWNEELKEIQVSIMGKIQLEILQEIAKDRFNLNIEFGPCEIMYKETINEEVIGYGHFEPLKHYAEVHLKLTPNKRGEGITFINNCHADNLSTGHQNLIKSHIFEREHNGILTGSPVTDINITLLTGRAHNKHTEGGDFREATFRALRQGLEQVPNILLEPYYKFKINVELDYMGRVISDIQRLSGEFEAPIIGESKVTIIGRGPVSTFMDYSSEILTFTKGKGNISLVFDSYDICHNQEEAIERRGYDKGADTKYTSNSVFCSKGTGYIVKWEDAKDYMHCTSEEYKKR